MTDMNPFIEWLSRILDSWKFWVVIAPWEVGVRVRLGKRAVAMIPGFHLRIPFIDVITLVNTRMRIDGTPPVTVHGTSPHCTRYISATVGYYISDPLKAMSNFGLPGAVVVSKAQGEVAATRDERLATDALRAYFDTASGITIDFIKFVEDVEVRTYRMINGGAWVTSGHESTSGNGNTASARY